ncbi:MAG: orotate phosphoribosyltransferase [Sedimentisphaerales bacterium]|nr:orotate phosphoribosyltransferase [Sedimentisphaerales bacterium]
MDRRQLIERIKQVAYIQGQFILRSGRKSNYYLDKYLFETCPDILQAIAEEFARFVNDQITLIAGAELGGVALAAATSLLTHKPFVIVRNSRKGYGTTKLIEGRISPTDVVLLVEDIVTTGGQVLEAAEVLHQTGAKVARVVAVIDRMEGARETITNKGLAFDSILTRVDLGINS